MRERKEVEGNEVTGSGAEINACVSRDSFTLTTFSHPLSGGDALR